MDCVRQKMKQRLQNAMRTLRKSINKQQFYIQFSGTEYEVAQKPSRMPEGAETCSTGQIFQDGKCGKFCVSADCLVSQWCVKPMQEGFCVFFLSELWCGDVLQRRAGAVCSVFPWNLPGHGRSAVLWAVSQHRRTGCGWCQECVSVWR